MPRTNRTAAPLAGNRDVAELLSILRGHASPSLHDFQELLNQEDTLERQLEAAVRELAAMRRDLAEAERRRHPAANAMRKAVIVVQTQVLELREKLSALKQAVIEGAKTPWQLFWKKGSLRWIPSPGFSGCDPCWRPSRRRRPMLPKLLTGLWSGSKQPA